MVQWVRNRVNDWIDARDLIVADPNRSGGSVVVKTGQPGPRESYVRAVHRVVDILECLAQSDRHWTLSLIAREVDLPPSTTHRLLGTLEQRQLVFRHPDSDVYTLGYRLLSYASSVEQMADIRQIAMPELHRLRDATRATSALSVLSGYERVTAAVVPSPDEFVLLVRTGRAAPLHLGCFSRAMLAFLPEDERAAYLCTLGGFDLDGLLAELEQIRSTRVAVTMNGMMAGVGGVAAPVFRQDGRVVASVGVVVPTQSLTEDSVAAFGNRVNEAARRISVLTGYSEESLAKVDG